MDISNSEEEFSEEDKRILEDLENEEIEKELSEEELCSEEWEYALEKRK